MSATTLRSRAQLREVAAQAAPRLAGADAHTIIEWALGEFGTRWAIASSMQDAVLPHLVSSVAPGIEVLFLDTGFHFPETLHTRDQVAAAYPLRVRDLHPEPRDDGPTPYADDPDRCCFLRKETPLYTALMDYEAWGTGLRRAESATRARAAEVTFDQAHDLVKINPIVAWTDADVADYTRRHDVIRNPLLERGYPSIGCAPCTRAVRPGEDPRAGRWAGSAKTECGIHR